MRLVVQCGFFCSLLVHLVAQRPLGEVFPLPLKIYSVDPTFVRCSNPNGIFVHQTNCSLFHFCSLGIHHVYSCLNGYFYNPFSQRCEEEFFSPFDCRKISKWNFYPIDELIIETNQSDYRKSFQSICVHQGIYPDVFDCSLFHICHDNSRHQIVRCPSGFHFDPKTSICLRSQLVNCQYERSTMNDDKFHFQKVQCENSPDGTFLPMPKKIDEFFLCQSRRKIIQMKCKTGFFYNALTNSCENGPCLFDSTLCQNDGQCVDDPTIRRGFRCICSDLFNGEFCEYSRRTIELTSMSIIITENETTHVPFVDSFNYPQSNSIAVFDDELSPSIDELFKLLFLVISICVLFIAFIAIIYGFYRWIRLNRFSSSMTDSVSEWKILAEESKV